MSAIKKFFEKRKLDVKFKKAGEGHRLTATNKIPPSSQPGPSIKNPSKSDEMTDEKKMAADAAIARLNIKKENESRGYTKPTMSMKAEYLTEKREMELAVAQAKKYSSTPKQINLDTSTVVTGVYFKCPMLGIEEPMSKEEMEIKMEEYLYSQLLDEPELTSAMMIYTFNKKDVLKSCIETLNKYLTNILENSDNPIYRRIKRSNKVLNEKVLNCRGAIEFLQATGFELKMMKVSEDSDEDEFFVLDINPENKNEVLEKLRNLKEVLHVCEPVKMELYRDLKVFGPNSLSSISTNNIEVSKDFYNVSPEELKREMKIREEAIKEMGMLRTKAMRERDRIKELRRYRFAAIRVKFPDNYAIQGTFQANETFSKVRNFVSDCLESNFFTFHLSTQIGGKITEEEKTLAELDLAPASILQFSYDQDVMKDVLKQSAKGGKSFLKSNLTLSAMDQ